MHFYIMCGWHLHLYHGCSIFVYNSTIGANCNWMRTIVWYLYLSMVSDRELGTILILRWTGLPFSRHWRCKASLQHSPQEQCEYCINVTKPSGWLMIHTSLILKLLNYRRFSGGDETNSFPVSGSEVKESESDNFWSEIPTRCQL